MSENYRYKESWSTDLSPRHYSTGRMQPAAMVALRTVAGGVYPGYGTGVVPEGCYTGYPPSLPQDPY